MMNKEWDTDGISVINPNREHRQSTRDAYRKNNEENYQRMLKSSTRGGSSSRTYRKRKAKFDTSQRKMKKLLGAAVVGAVVAVAGMNLSDKVMERSVINGLAYEFHDQVIRPETHRTDDYKNYYYDYSDILRAVESMEDFDEGVFLLTESIGDYQTGLVLAGSEYGSFTNYKKVKGYEDTKSFAKAMSEQILLKHNGKDRKEQLADMFQNDEQEEIVMADSVFHSEIGGK